MRLSAALPAIPNRPFPDAFSGSEQENFQQLDDEELVLLIQQHGHAHPATTLLVVRYQCWLTSVIKVRARHCWLPASEWPDAVQEGALAILQAIDDFDLVQERSDKRCSFRSFLYIVVLARFNDFMRKFNRAEIHLDRSTRANNVLERESIDKHRLHRSVDRPRYEPLACCERRELLANLEMAVDQLEPTFKSLCEELIRGESLQSISIIWHIPYSQLKRRWRAIRHVLASQLRGSWE